MILRMYIVLIVFQKLAANFFINWPNVVANLELVNIATPTNVLMMNSNIQMSNVIAVMRKDIMPQDVLIIHAVAGVDLAAEDLVALDHS